MQTTQSRFVYGVTKSMILAFMSSYVRDMRAHPFYPKESRKGFLSEGFWTAIEYYKDQIQDENVIDSYKEEVERNTGLTLYPRSEMVVLTSSQVVSPEYFALLYKAWVQDVKDSVPNYVDVDTSFDSWLNKTIVGHKLRENAEAITRVRELIREETTSGEIGVAPSLEEEEGEDVATFLSRVHKQSLEEKYTKLFMSNQKVSTKVMLNAIRAGLGLEVLYYKRRLPPSVLREAIERGELLNVLFTYQKIPSSLIGLAIDKAKDDKNALKCLLTFQSDALNKERELWIRRRIQFLEGRAERLLSPRPLFKVRE